MSLSLHPGISVYICRQCILEGVHIPRQWTQNDVLVQVTELPCSGKSDVQYFFHAIEAGAQGLLIVACPRGECHLAQGNYRAEIRVQMAQRLLAEIGMEPERITLLHYTPGEDLEALVRGAVNKFCELNKSPMVVHR